MKRTSGDQLSYRPTSTICMHHLLSRFVSLECAQTRHDAALARSRAIVRARVYHHRRPRTCGDILPTRSTMFERKFGCGFANERHEIHHYTSYLAPETSDEHKPAPTMLCRHTSGQAVFRPSIHLQNGSPSSTCGYLHHHHRVFFLQQ